MSNGDTPQAIFVGKGEQPAYLALGFANRHGLVTGATGTGKTVTLQVLAEGLLARRRAGVRRRHQGRSLGHSAARRGEGRSSCKRAKDDGSRPYSPTSSRRSSGTCSASRAIRCAPPCPRWGRCCCRACWTSTTCRRACSTSPSGWPTSRACCCSTSRTCGRCSPISPNTPRSSPRNTATSRRRPSAPSSASCWCWKIRARRSSSASRRSTSRTSCAPTATAAA